MDNRLGLLQPDYRITIGAIYNTIGKVHPTTTITGINISGISSLTMFVRYRAKLNVGHALDSDPIISDAHWALTCFYLSYILMGSSLLFEFCMYHMLVLSEVCALPGLRVRKLSKSQKTVAVMITIMRLVLCHTYM